MYIRTKDGVYKVSHYNDWATHKRKGATLIDGDKASYIKNEDIIAQSENLYELCDCFVAVRKNASGTYSVFFIEFEDWKTWINGYDIYGAIWTSKGLIYVAKMNEKGELELL